MDEHDDDVESEVEIDAAQETDSFPTTAEDDDDDENGDDGDGLDIEEDESEL